MTKNRILLTGFEPFGPHKRNPSWDALVAFQDQRLGPFHCHCEQLPVDYAMNRDLLPTLWQLPKLHTIVHFGVMSAHAPIRLERQAVNEIGATPDNSGEVRHGQACIDDAPTSLTTSIDLDALQRVLASAGVESSISLDAGRYLCNDTYYRSLHWAQGRAVRVLFVHVPPVHEAWPLSRISQAAREIVCALPGIDKGIA